MRLFKRRSLDQSPELVSATPIDHQDQLAAGADEKMMASTMDLITPKKSGCVEEPKSASMPRKEQQQHTPLGKSFTTWSRKVGQKWDQLKRADSSELLSVSNRRKRWSPHRKSCADPLDEAKKSEKSTPSSSPEFAKPKRISRVESLRNLFKSSTERISTSTSRKKSAAIKEEDEDAGHRMEKSLSEGALKHAAPRFEELANKRWQISRSIHDLEKQSRVLDYFLINQAALKTSEGKAMAQRSLEEAEAMKRLQSGRMMQHRQRKFSEESNDELNSSGSSSSSHEAAVEGVKRDLFNARGSNESGCEPTKASVITGLEELMSGLKLASDESGYDSDSTRAGADSPDSEKSVMAPLSKPRSFSITSDDYHGIDLSLDFSTPKKQSPQQQQQRQQQHYDNHGAVLDCNESLIRDDFADESTLVGCSDSLNESNRTDTTIILADEDIAADFNFQSASLSRMSSADSGVQSSSSSMLLRTPEKSRQSASARSATKTKLQKSLKVQRKASNVSVLNLLDNASSPCKDSPPASKIIAALRDKTQLQYYNPKRPRDAMEQDTPNEQPLKKPATPKPTLRSTSMMSAPKTPLTRRELKTMKLKVAANLGISIQRYEAVRPYYVIANMDQRGEAHKSKLFRVGDEVVRVQGRRLRGMSLAEAKSSLKNCIGEVELQIAREPNFFYGNELGDTWGSEDMMVRSKSDSEIWGPMVGNGSPVEQNFDAPIRNEKESASKRGSTTTTTTTKAAAVNDCQKSEDKDIAKTCQIIGAVTKDGRTVSIQDMECSDSEDQKVTGMKKFQIRKRSSTLASGARRATSLSLDLLTVALEKGGPKRLGFTIVGGSDSNKGKMGIFIKDILPDGQAAEQAVLKVEDEILAINGVPLEGMTHARALQVFKTAKKGKLVLHVGRRDSSHKRTPLNISKRGSAES